MGIYLGRTLRDLDTLRVSLEASEANPTEGVVVFELFLSGVRSVRVQVPASEMNVPASLKEISAYSYRYTQPEFAIPESVMTSLLDGMADRANQDDPLWLEVDPPLCVLSIVPWESLLQPALRTRLIRLSFFPASSYFPHWNTLDIVICASSPKAKVSIAIENAVPLLARQILETQKIRTTIHIFADAKVYDALKTALAPKIVPKGEHGVVLYDPAGAAQYEAPQRTRKVVDERDKVTNPWLRWMMDSLAGQTIDLVHFVCHGFLYTDQGALALAQSPLVNNDENWARFVGPRQLNTFLDSVGAYSAAFCSPVYNYSIPALRLFSEQLARLRPGVALLHTSHDDPTYEDLASTYEALYCGDRHNLTNWESSTTLYCSPKLIKTEELVSADPPESGGGGWQPVVIKSTFDPATPKDHGTWVSSGFRWLERTASEISSESSTSESQASTKQAVEETLMFVSNVISQYSLKK
ncbi:MAG TPA: hypothetical protein VFZ22_07680 [Pyrinomonadaceae bacterium]|nr:hypothetical protein [Pyrinomonadaceae bacterium]